MASDQPSAMDALIYISDKTANAACPMCSNKTWAYATQSDKSPCMSLFVYERDQAAMTIPSVPLTCEKCGFIRFHDLAMVSVKIKEQSGNE
jgi:hypothetical protein